MKKHIFSSLQIENGPHMVSKEDYRDGNQDLQVLLRTVVGTDYQSGVLTGPENPLNITLKDLLSALIGAAVHLWVFSRTFHSIDMTNTPLLQKYREAIATSCTDQSLFNLDVAVHQKLIKERDFEDLTIPRLTARHTDRFLAAVKILDSETQANEFRYSIEHIFKLAIRIRTSFLVAAETYVSFWPCRGQKINCNDMESPLMGNILENNVVRLPISPGLHVYAREKGMVEYNYPDNDKWDNATLKDTFQATILV
ncbi:hypothetical protein B0J11DRAFT_527554 [Dendryphion nanum]|uniref:Uncharacterized protein n=1 Tax=Dendryphion nanum TaxID=256645 RepID=A0A9P9DTP6_9PLEO|nr:hypothetical protein B0J11DRAFT_527554 [Dendryphion nanum]